MTMQQYHGHDYSPGFGAYNSRWFEEDYWNTIKRVETKKGALYVGPFPSIDELEKDGPFNIIWNLSLEQAYYAELEELFAEKVIIGSIEDLYVPYDPVTFIEQLEEVLICLHKGGKVFIHCLGGHGRTGMALACIKVFLDGNTFGEAIMFARREVKGPELMMQVDFVKQVIESCEAEGF